MQRKVGAEMKWIKVEDRLPAKDSRVIATSGFFTGEFYYFTKTKPRWTRYPTFIETFDSEIIAWMPMPEYLEQERLVQK